MPRTTAPSPTPTGVARRRPRISDAETGDRMLRAALDLVAERGLTVGLDHLSLEAVIARADVSRASAYRRWPYKDLFLADLLVQVAQDTELSAEPPGLVAEIRALVAATDLSDARARRDLLVEALRLSGGAELERLSTSPRWRTYVALSATVTGLPEGPIREASATAIGAAEERFAARRERVYRNLADLIGYRTKPGVDPDTAFGLLARTSGAAMTGFIVRALVAPVATVRQPLAPFGSSREADWSVAEYGLVAVFDAFLEPDPDAVWTEETIAERLRRLDDTVQHMYDL